MDISKKTIKILQQRFPELEFIVGDIRCTTFPDKTFDAYFSWGVFEHFENGPQDCIHEAYRILKPGGLLFISVPFDNLRHALQSCFKSWREKKESFSQRFYQWRFTKSELAKELQLGGFSILNITAIHNRSGILRCLENDFKMEYNSNLSRGIAYLLAPVIPKSLTAHMIIATSRKISD
jgi:ubiquinone/menaquinone biosynthesis C-methylase UbiE